MRPERLPVAARLVALTVLVIFFYSAKIGRISLRCLNPFPGKLLGYTSWMQLKDIAPILLLSLLMAGCVYGLSFLPLPDALLLLIQIPLGIAIYAGGARLLKLDSFDYLLAAVRNMISKKRAG